MKKIQKFILSLPLLKIGSFFAFYLFLSIPLFAQAGGSLPPGLEGMNDLASAIFNIFSSSFVTIILAIFFCGSALAYAFNKDNDKVKRNCIAIGIATGIIVVSQQIVTFIWNSSGG